MIKNFKLLVLILILFSIHLFATQYVAIMELNGTISKTESGILTDKLINLLTSTGDYRVIERSQMKSILQEQEFQQTGCTSGECAVEVGQILGVEMIISGSIGKLGSLYSIALRKINVATGEIEGTASYEVRGTIEDVLTRGLAKSVAQLNGEIVTAEPETVVVEDKKEVELTPQAIYESRKKKKTVFTVITGAAAGVSAGMTAYFWVDMNKKKDFYDSLISASKTDYDDAWNSVTESRIFLFVSGGAAVGFTTAAIIIGTRKIEMPSGNEVSITPVGTLDSASLTVTYHF